MNNWLSMDSTLRIFSKTNSSSCIWKIFNSSSRWLFEANCGFFYIKKSKFHLDQDSKENGRFRWKTEKPMSQKFLRGHGLEISLRGSWRVTRISGGETLKISKWVSHHGFSRSIDFRHYLHFSNWMRRNQDIVIWRFWLIAKLELKGHNWSNQKSQNGFFLMSSLWFI